ncbi:MAG: hypothetical protein K8R24_10060 [Mycobacterium sp.]|nr:hypothetical protein [Mycobacterium sp.]
MNVTDAEPFGPLTSTLLPETESIDPATSSSPFTFAGVMDGAAADVVAAVVEEAVGATVLDALQPTADSAATPVIASTENNGVDDLYMVAPDQR